MNGVRVRHCRCCGCYVTKVHFCSDLCRRRFEIKSRAAVGPTVLELWERRKAALEKIEELVEEERDSLECPDTCGGNPVAKCWECVNFGPKDAEEIVEEFRKQLMEKLEVVPLIT